MIHFYKCGIKDISVLMDVGYRSYKDHYYYLWKNPLYAEWYMEKSFGVKILQKQIKEPEFSFFIIYQNSSPVGMLKLITPQNLDFIDIEKIYLAANATGLGIGTSVINFIIKIAAHINRNRLILQAMEKSRSVEFYLKNGFYIIKSEILPYEGLKEEYRSILTMQKNL